MKTTLDLPDELMRHIKIRAVNENRKLKDMVAELLQRGLASDAPSPDRRHRVKFPLIECNQVKVGRDLTPDEIAEVLNDQEASWHLALSSKRV